MSAPPTRVIALGGLTVGVLLIGAGIARSEPRPVVPVSPEHAVRDLDIAFFEARVERDSLGARDRAMLGALYLQRARETGNPGDLLEAEAVARESFGVRHRNNEMALHVLASSLVGQHRYREALDEVRILVEEFPDNLAYRALRGEIETELGLYAAADSTFRGLRSWSHRITVAPRLARWAELNGDPGTARRLLLDARQAALGQANLPREQKAWFHLQVGDLAFRYGRPQEAAAAWLAGLELSPEDHRLLSAMSRLELSRRRQPQAIAYGEAAIALSLDPATLGLLADAYRQLGDTARATEYARTMERIVLAQPGVYHRAWSLYLLDHDRQVGSVLRNVELELADRKDIYGYDLLAWALHKNGRSCEARGAMKQALRLGTRDPVLLRHAGEIERACG